MEHITKKMTGGKFDLPRENTRVNSAYEQDYLNWKEFKAAMLGVEMYKIGTDIYNGYKLSKDGLERDEYTRILERKNEDSQGRDVGWQEFKMGQDGFDCIIMITGRRRTGKSTLGIQIAQEVAKLVGDTFTIDKVAFRI